MKLSFHGADRSVTGSCHMVECAGKTMLVDCGLDQGDRESAEVNAGDFGFDPASVDVLLLTHAHLDHCGRIPLLVKRGFKGEIIATAATRELTRLVLLDSAHQQEEEAKRRAQSAELSGESAAIKEPLYGILDALAAFDRFGRIAAYDQPIDVANGVRVTFVNAGHILGSASIVLDLAEDDRRQRVVFSGDLGPVGRPLLSDAEPPADADVVVMETTYGDRLHRPLDQTVEEFYGAVSDCFARGGNVVIPTFALERAQEVLYYLREGVDRQRLAGAIQVFLDSPMAISATEVFKRHPEACAPDLAERLRGGDDPFQPPGLHLSRETADSIAINRVTGGAVILAGSGMCTGGRVLHHLRHNLGRPASAVVFVGYAAAGTLARKIIDGAPQVTIGDDRIRVRARIHTINGFSAHADQAGLIAWRARTNAKRTFLTHGEEATMRAFAAKLDGAPVEMPKLGQSYEI
jgi:metallo-beta-lactamase family protein